MVRESGRKLSKLFNQLQRKNWPSIFFFFNHTELTDQTSIANAFNDYFPNIGNDLASAIPSVHKCL